MQSKKLALFGGGFILLLVAANVYTAGLSADATRAPESARGPGIEEYWRDRINDAGGDVKTAVNVQGEEAYWYDRIKTKGGARAYKELSEYLTRYDIPSQHTIAHLFGRELYQVEGLEGVSVCDSRFAFGCFHEFLTYAVSDHGTGIIDRLDHVCRSQSELIPFVACQHGIGHGLVSVEGYDLPDLQSALAWCATLKDPGSMGGCYAGAFMEYNRRGMIASESGPRFPKDGDFITPCNQIASDARAACVLWQPLWWHADLFSASHAPETFATFGDMCRALDQEIGHRETCFYGIGFVVSPTIIAGDAGAELCQAAAATLQEERWCLNYAAYIAGALSAAEDGPKVCVFSDEENRPLCERYARATQSSILTARDLPAQ